MSSREDVPFTVESLTGKGLVVLTFSVLSFLLILQTPVPNAPEVSCDRPCHELEWPRICRVQFVLESHAVSGRNCSESNSYCLKEEFPLKSSDNVLTVNREIPGPKIYACVHDILLVDVINKLPDNSVTLHWRGQVQRNEPLMDGAPMISQCPITSFTTFQYKFRLSDPGTHLWHLHNRMNGYGNSNNIYGSLVVRESSRTEPHRKLINYDESNHMIVLRTVKNSQQSASIIINGRPAKDKDHGIQLTVRKNKNYRFRVAHSGGDVNCPIAATVDNHNLLVITLDGNPIEPVYIKEFVIAPGERLDFVLLTNQVPGKYYAKFTFAKECNLKATSFMALNCTEDIFRRRSREMTKRELDYPHKQGLSTAYSEECNGTSFCLEDIQNYLNVPENILEKTSTVLYLFYDRQKIELENVRGSSEIGFINNITFVYPPSPLVSQFSDVPPETICSAGTVSVPSCYDEKSNVCECTHVIELQQGSVVELVLIHQENEPKRDHIFHLHGHKFYVLGRSKVGKLKSVSDIKKADEEGKLVLRNFKKPVLKDTLIVPRGGVAVVRFLADNAGFWLLREEGGDAQGMELVFNVVGGSQHTIPGTFPRCGNWVGPKFFLA